MWCPGIWLRLTNGVKSQQERFVLSPIRDAQIKDAPWDDRELAIGDARACSSAKCLNGMGHEPLDPSSIHPSQEPLVTSEHGSPAGRPTPEPTQLLVCGNHQVPIETLHHSVISYCAFLAVPKSEKSPCGSASLPWKYFLPSLHCRTDIQQHLNVTT